MKGSGDTQARMFLNEVCDRNIKYKLRFMRVVRIGKYCPVT